MSFSIPEGMFEFLNKTQIIFGNLGILKIMLTMMKYKLINFIYFYAK